MSAIECDGLTKQFGRVRAVDALDLRVEEGEIFGFLGPNGAGKSTTINMLLDFVRPTAGSVAVLGLDAQADSLAVRQRVGVLPDGYHVYDRLTGRQHVRFAIESKQADDDPDAILERAGIPEAADRKAGGYSKGMKQRLVLGMALVGQPDLLVLDEPTTGLDPKGAREVRDIVREERDRGATVFFSSHVLGQVEAVCDRVGILQDGELVAVDTIEGLRAANGAGSRLRIDLDRPYEKSPATIEAIPGVSSVDGDGDSDLTVTCEDPAKNDVLAAIEREGYRITDFATEETSLEDLFVAYTDGDAVDSRAATTKVGTPPSNGEGPAVEVSR
ncbi:MAG TPA: ABC transporter ATP-binding protein [Natrialbaceae archaeon]|nr:ABC transporter ATP-binding protein [Natrialbaceae archaeon]